MESSVSYQENEYKHQANETVGNEHQVHLTTTPVLTAIPENVGVVYNGVRCLPYVLNQAPIAYRLVQAPILLNPMYGNVLACQPTNTLKTVSPCLGVVYNKGNQAVAADHAEVKQERVGKVQVTSMVKEDEIVYVNAKQYKRILIRRKARQKLVTKGKIPSSSIRVKYLHESRHRHASARERGYGGRFLPKLSDSKFTPQTNDDVRRESGE